MFVIPRTKQIASRIFDLPEPLRPVMELKLSSLRDAVSNRKPLVARKSYHPDITVRTAYDLKPSMISSITLILSARFAPYVLCLFC